MIKDIKIIFEIKRDKLNELEEAYLLKDINYKINIYSKFLILENEKMFFT